MEEGLRKYDLDHIKEKLGLAKQIVTDEDEPYKTEAFKIIFSKLIHSSLDNLEDNLVKETTKQETSLEKKKLELAKNCSLSVKELDDVFSIHGDSIKIISPIKGNESFKRLIASQCYLISSEIILEKDWVESKELAEVMRDIGVKDLSNLAPQLKKNAEIFRIDSKPGNNKYKLTSGAGRKKAFEIIHKLAKGELLED